ncbi:unnamed protein product [Periconia digitata]|uniref:DNA repair metallo-beta-lactamase domain-containing protein n=1 Tax=Periconia digitata TaxID=1303443 RepID=A0A9W4XHT3_9PLEO|nr:unnamed protein product [Periconia digitata]
MFRNPRENRALPQSAQVNPSVGRPPSPSPPRFPSRNTPLNMAAKPVPKKAISKPTSNTMVRKTTQTTLVPSAWGKRSSASNGKSKPKPVANGNIKAFFKKAEALNNQIFLQDRGANTSLPVQDSEWDGAWTDEVEVEGGKEVDDDEGRYNESSGSYKKRKLDQDDTIVRGISPVAKMEHSAALKVPPADTREQIPRVTRKIGPFVDDSDSEPDDETSIPRRGTLSRYQNEVIARSELFEESHLADQTPPIDPVPPFLKPKGPSNVQEDHDDDFADVEDDLLLEGEEYDERRWMAEQHRLEAKALGFEGDLDDFDPPDLFPDNDANDTNCATPTCPLCNTSLSGLSEQDASIHVNACLDGKPLPIAEPNMTPRDNTPPGHKVFKRQPRPPKPAQENPIQLGDSIPPSKSAFTRLMSNHAEDAAWATAAADQNAARGKPAYQRTCPFYKIMPGFFICVDAFRYGAVEGQHAYFLSHFHSDHYVGLTASWSHGPIYCSKVTANLVRQQLRVDPKWVVDLEFEEKTEIPGTEGVHVSMISANHCPGSSLFLFEKEMTKGPNPRVQRVLHCGDFRACQAHIEHPLLKPEVIDTISGKSRYQKLDICYLDTTYLNPKYAFPPQQQVIQACADMCVSLNKETVDMTDGYEQMKRDRAGAGMAKFVQKGPMIKTTECDSGEAGPANKDQETGAGKNRGRLLVIVGTYSIGKERICIGIAKALNSKIYAPPNKQRICRALEDPELDELLTKNPREAQIHMTPLFEIRADTLEDYLSGYPEFSRAVGFRPSGWNYRPPKSRFTESPSVQTVLHSDNWKSQFTMRDLTAQRGSTQRAKCFGVPYSEHSSFRELTMFCCALRIEKIIPTVNVGSAKSRDTMKAWCERWATDRKKNGLFRLGEDGSGW